MFDNDYVLNKLISIFTSDTAVLESTSIDQSTYVIVNILALTLLASFIQLIYKVTKNSATVRKSLRELSAKYTVAQRHDKFITSIDPLAFYRASCMHSTMYSRLPNLMTSLGILGTFYGISSSLIGLEIDSQHIANSVFPVISGMKTAFFTSLVGISCSLVYLFIGVLFESFYKYFVYYPGLGAVKKKYEQETAAMYLRNQANLSDGLGDAAETLVSVFDSIKETINPEVTAKILGDAIRPALENIADKMEAFSEIKDINKDLKENNERLGNFITQEMDGIFKSMERALDKTISTIETTNTSIVKTREGLEDQMKSFSLLDGTLKDLPIELKEMLSHVHIQLEHFSDEYQKGLNSYLDRQGEHLDKHLGKHADKLSDVVVNFSSAINQSNEAFQKTLEMQIEVGERLFKIVKTSKEEEEFVKTAIQEAAIQLDEKIMKHTSITRSIENTLVLCDEKFAKIEGAINEDVISGITDFCHRQKKVIEEYQSQVDGHMVTILNQLFAAVGYIEENKQTMSKESEL